MKLSQVFRIFRKKRTRNLDEPEKSVVKYQYLAAILVNILTICEGIGGGWAEPTINLLTSSESPLPSGTIDWEEASWIASLICVGGTIGNVFFGYIAEKFGRKIPLILITIPMIISWVLVLCAQNVYYLYVARMLHGLTSAGVFVLNPLYVSEIACDRVRGALGSMLIMNDNIGILLAFAIGTYCDFYVTPIVAIMLITVFVISFSRFPESPTYLMKRNQVSQAEKSLRFYYAIDENDTNNKLIETEMNKLKSALADLNTEKSVLTWSDVSTGLGRKALMIGISLSALNQFCGCYAMLNYTGNIFAEAGSNMTPNAAAIVVGSILLVGSYMSTVLVERAGRKPLLIASTIGTALGLTTLAVYMMLKSWGYKMDAYNWIPLVSFSFVLFIASLGVLTLPFIVIFEIMPEKLKEFGYSFCMTFLWLLAFFVLKYFPLLADKLGFHGSMFLFASVCVVGATFIACYLPETRGKSYEEIMNSL